MGDLDSSLTRVQPVFNALLDRWPDGEAWLGELWDLAVATGPAPLPRPDIGRLLASEAPTDHDQRLGKVFERIVPSPAAFLRWLIDHPDRMQVRNPITFGATSDEAREQRSKLFSTDASQRAEAQKAARDHLALRGTEGSGRQWWAFEGFSHIDCCFITDTCVMFVEGKRTESVSPATLWFEKRSQLWRNVEAAEQFARGKQFGVVLACETDDAGVDALTHAKDSLAPSFPHLTEERRSDLARHLLGFVTWADIVARFGLPEECLPERVFSDRHVSAK